MIRGYNVFVSYLDPSRFGGHDQRVVDEIETRGGIVTEYSWDNGMRRIRGYFENSATNPESTWAEQSSRYCGKALEQSGFDTAVCEVCELVSKSATQAAPKPESCEGQASTGPIKRYGYNIFITTGSACVDEARAIILECGGRVYDVEELNGATTKLRGYFQALAGCELAEKAARSCFQQLQERGYTLSEFQEWPVGSIIVEEPGRVENVKVSDRALSREEIERDYAAQCAEIDRIAVGALFGITVGESLAGDEDDDRADAGVVAEALHDRNQNANFAASYGPTGSRPGSTGPDPNGPNPDHNPTDDFVAGIEHEAWSEGWDEGFDEGYDEGYDAAEVDMQHDVKEVLDAADDVVASATRLLYSAELNDGTDEREEAFDKGFSAGIESAEATAAARTSVVEEIALARVTVEQLVNQCTTGDDFLLFAPQINDLLVTIERLVRTEAERTGPDYDRGFNDGTDYGMELAEDIDDELNEDGWQDAADDLDLDDWDDEEDEEDLDEDDDEYGEGYDDGFEDGEEEGHREGFGIGIEKGYADGQRDLLAELVDNPQKALAVYRLSIAMVGDDE